MTENHGRKYYIEIRRELNPRPQPGIELATSGQTRVKIIMSVLAILGQNSDFRSKFSKIIDWNIRLINFPRRIYNFRSVVVSIHAW